jgi:adenylate kinase
VGKRTQATLLAEKFNLSVVMTGDLLKNAIAEQSQLGLEAKAMQDAGRAVTEDIILGLLREHLLNPAMKNGFLLEGFPRNLLQALTLDELLFEIGLPLDLVLLIDIDSDNLMERLVGRLTCRNCGQLYNAYRTPPVVDGVCDRCGGRLHQRSDDNEETVSNRIHVFDHLVAPLITHYKKNERLTRVDGNGEVDTVFKLLVEVIENTETDRDIASLPAGPIAAREQISEELPFKSISGNEVASTIEMPQKAINESSGVGLSNESMVPEAALSKVADSREKPLQVADSKNKKAESAVSKPGKRGAQRNNLAKKAKSTTPAGKTKVTKVAAKPSSAAKSKAKSVAKSKKKVAAKAKRTAKKRAKAVKKSPSKKSQLTTRKKPSPKTKKTAPKTRSSSTKGAVKQTAKKRPAPKKPVVKKGLKTKQKSSAKQSAKKSKKSLAKSVKRVTQSKKVSKKVSKKGLSKKSVRSKQAISKRSAKKKSSNKPLQKKRVKKR